MYLSRLKWHIILALAVLAFSGMAAAEQFYVNESGWWRDGGVFNTSETPISAAVGAAGAGDAIFVHGGNYYENVDVDKPRLTLEGAGADVVSVTAASSGDHVFEVTADWVNISGFTMTGAPRQIGVFPSGIYLGSGISHCNISNNNASNNYYCGICLSSSSNNTLTNNRANLNIERGICLRDSNNNKLINNIVTDARYGISLYHSSNNTLTNNTCSSNSDGILLCDSNHNMLSNNMAISNDNYLMDRCFGILLSSSSNNSLVNNTANSNKYCGIGLYSSSDNEITCNLVQNNTRGGFYLSNSFSSGSINNNISHNNIIKNGALQGDDSYHWQFYNYQSNPVPFFNTASFQHIGKLRRPTGNFSKRVCFRSFVAKFYSNSYFILWMAIYTFMSNIQMIPITIEDIPSLAPCKIFLSIF